MTKKVSQTLTDDLWERLEKHCTDKQQSRSEVIRNIIIESFYSK
ncbi:ribbon-helix-helix protein, CopG family [Paenibacillus sp. Soil787]|nr:ribbon-helix-helix protein, CopG family [Paenibacillus sp. Soil787]